MQRTYLSPLQNSVNSGILKEEVSHEGVLPKRMISCCIRYVCVNMLALGCHNYLFRYMSSDVDLSPGHVRAAAAAFKVGRTSVGSGGGLGRGGG